MEKIFDKELKPLYKAEVTKDPQVELIEAKRAIAMFCYHLETKGLTVGHSAKQILDAITESYLYQEMKEKSK